MAVCGEQTERWPIVCLICDACFFSRFSFLLKGQKKVRELSFKNTVLHKVTTAVETKLRLGMLVGLCNAKNSTWQPFSY